MQVDTPTTLRSVVWRRHPCVPFSGLVCRVSSPLHYGCHPGHVPLRTNTTMIAVESITSAEWEFYSSGYQSDCLGNSAKRSEPLDRCRHLGMPANPETGSVGLKIDMSSLSTFTWVGNRPDCSAQLSPIVGMLKFRPLYCSLLVAFGVEWECAKRVLGVGG